MAAKKKPTPRKKRKAIEPVMPTPPAPQPAPPEKRGRGHTAQHRLSGHNE